jgi:hypothetical protein
MPLYLDHEERIRFNLDEIHSGHRPQIIPIGFFTEKQFTDINLAREEYDLHQLETNEILFMGRHVYKSRTDDGYTLENIVEQIVSALHETSIAVVTQRMSCTRSTIARADGYGNFVYDQAVFEMSNRKPRAELYSVIPKGDAIKPTKK